jgi:outer membrane receptor protein involved in Fe transport
MQWEVVNGFTIKGGVAYTYGQNVTKDEPLRRIPPLNGRLMPAFRKNNWFAAIEFLFAGKQERLAKGDREDNRIPAGGTPGWQVCNAYMNCKKGGLQLGVGLQNIFNVDYRMHGSGINGVGRSAWFSTTLFF